MHTIKEVFCLCWHLCRYTMSGRPKDPVWEHGVNLAPGWRCNYCGMQKSDGGSTRFKQHLNYLYLNYQLTYARLMLLCLV
jgi:hypothetical protein